MKTIYREHFMDEPVRDLVEDGTNFDYLLKIVNLTKEPLKYQRSRSMYGGLNAKLTKSKYKFSDLQSHDYDKIYMYRADTWNSETGNGKQQTHLKWNDASQSFISVPQPITVDERETLVSGNVTFKLGRTDFDINFESTIKGINQLIIDDRSMRGNWSSKCDNNDNDNDEKIDCKISNGSCFNEIMKEKNSKGEKTCFIEKLKMRKTGSDWQETIPSPYIVRYAVTAGEQAVGVVIIDYA